MAIASRQPFSNQIEVLSKKGVSIIGSSIESLVGALARGYLGGRYAVATLLLCGSALALRLAEGSRGLYRAQPVILSPSFPGVVLPSIILLQAALYRSRAYISEKALNGSYVGYIQLVYLTSTSVAPLIFLESRISSTYHSSSPSGSSPITIARGQVLS